MRNSFSIGPMKYDYSRNKNVIGIGIVRIQFEVEIPLRISNNVRITSKYRETHCRDDKYGCHFAFFTQYYRMAVRMYFSWEDAHIRHL